MHVFELRALAFLRARAQSAEADGARARRRTGFVEHDSSSSTKKPRETWIRVPPGSNSATSKDASGNSASGPFRRRVLFSRKSQPSITKPRDGSATEPQSFGVLRFEHAQAMRELDRWSLLFLP